MWNPFAEVVEAVVEVTEAVMEAVVEVTEAVMEDIEEVTVVGVGDGGLLIGGLLSGMTMNNA